MPVPWPLLTTKLAGPALPSSEAGLVWGMRWDRLSQDATSGPTVPDLLLQEDPRSGCSAPVVSVLRSLQATLLSG